MYRVVRELLPRVRYTPEELYRWLEETQLRNERARRSHLKRRALRRAMMNSPDGRTKNQTPRTNGNLAFGIWFLEFQDSVDFLSKPAIIMVI